MSDFYISLPSNSSKNEFPENKSNSFKIRLPNPIHLEGHGWKVGLFSISMPDARVTLPTFFGPEGPTTTTLTHTSWRRYDPNARIIYAEAYFSEDELKKVFHDVNGVGLMKSMIAYFERQRIFAFGGPRFGAKYVGTDGKRSYVKFKWDGEDLVMDNKDIVCPTSMIPELNIVAKLALKMGWLEKKDGGGYDLGPNLQVEFDDDVIPDLSAQGDIKDKDGKCLLECSLG